MMPVAMWRDASITACIAGVELPSLTRLSDCSKAFPSQLEKIALFSQGKLGKSDRAKQRSASFSPPQRKRPALVPARAASIPGPLAKAGRLHATPAITAEMYDWFLPRP
jgi:hypothetical protein